MSKRYDGLFLPGLPVDKVVSALEAAPGDELASGKFANPESSAALAVNTFGFFVDAPEKLPPLAHIDGDAWIAESVRIECCLHFPWRGGRHPWLDAVIETKDYLIGVESKRFEPFRARDAGSFSKAYWRPVWGSRMGRFERLRDKLNEKPDHYQRLDAVQLVKHAFGIRTQAEVRKRKGALFYLYAEPKRWPDADGRSIPKSSREEHVAEARDFAKQVSGDEIDVVTCSYRELLESMRSSTLADVRQHALAVEERFSP